MCKGAVNETRTRDPDLGKVVLYQLSYYRINTMLSQLFQLQKHLRFTKRGCKCTRFFNPAKFFHHFYFLQHTCSRIQDNAKPFFLL